MGSRAALISAIVIRPLVGLWSFVIVLFCARTGVMVGIFLIEAIGERQFAITFDIDSRLLHSMERMPPVLIGFATRALRACFNDLVAREVAKAIVRLSCMIESLLFQYI